MARAGLGLGLGLPVLASHVDRIIAHAAGPSSVCKASTGSQVGFVGAP